MIRNWNVIISGRSQTEGTLHGCQALYYLMHDSVARPQNITIQPPWNHDFAALASRISNDPAMNVKINVYAYSWGCGNGLLKLAGALQKLSKPHRKLEIDHAVLCDPVYHSQRFESWPGIGHLMRGIGVLRAGTITIPSNVREVSWFRQKKTVPIGCDLRREKGAETIIHDGILLGGRGHDEMDDSPDWHFKCLKVAGAIT
jgi:hypothetical protein